MRQHTIGTTLAILFLLGLGLAASVPQAQATSLEKFPSNTSVIVAGWANPTNAYADDGSYTVSSTDGAVQQFSGFGFAFNGTESIEKVYLKVEWMGNIFGFGDFFCWIFGVYSGDGAEVFFNDDVTQPTADGTISATKGLMTLSVDITTFIGGNHTTLNNFAMRITSVFIPAGTSDISVDFVSVEVAYTTEESPNMLPVGFLLGALIILPIGILIAKKR